MLAHAPELSLSLVHYLTPADLSLLSLANRTLCVLLRPRLYRYVTLSIKNPFLDGKEAKLAKRTRKQVKSLLSGARTRLKLVKKITLVGCEWTSSQLGLNLLENLGNALEVEEMEFHHRAPFPTEDIELRWKPLWQLAASQKQSLTSLTILGSVRRESGKPALYARQISSQNSSDTLVQHLPRSLRALSLSSVDLVESPHEAIPSAVFANLESLELVDLDSSLLASFVDGYEAFKPSVDISPLKRLSINLCVEHHPSWEASTPSVHFLELLDLLGIFGGSQFETLELNSTPFAPPFLHFSVSPPGAEYDEENESLEVTPERFLAVLISASFPNLQSVNFVLHPRLSVWVEESLEQTSVVSLAKLSCLRHLATNIFIITDTPLSSASIEETATIVAQTISSIGAIIPSLENITTLPYGPIPRDKLKAPSSLPSRVYWRWGKDEEGELAWTAEGVGE